MLRTYVDFTVVPKDAKADKQCAASLVEVFLLEDAEVTVKCSDTWRRKREVLSKELAFVILLQELTRALCADVTCTKHMSVKQPVVNVF